MFNTRKTVRHLSVTLTLSLLAIACGGGQSTATTASSDSVSGGPESTNAAPHDEGDFWFGEPGDEANSTRVIDVDAADDFTFMPSDVAVNVGETVTFRVHNVGKVPHDFTLGDSEMQDAHETEMQSGDQMHGGGDPNAIVIDPGATSSLTFTFTQPGQIIFGCHVSGHYAAGMRGALVIES